MASNKEKINKAMTAETIKTFLIDLLRSQGYKTFADRLEYYKLIIADRYHGWPISVAAMSQVAPEIIINPNMIDESKIVAAGDDPNVSPYNKMMN